MAKKSQQAFAKRKKELERKRKAQEKMEKRQNKKKLDMESNGFEGNDGNEEHTEL